jgi:ADP-heptose:LPS heptosyltransferase
LIKAHDVSSIVVRAPNWVGDAVMSVAALRELRRLFPNSHISVVSITSMTCWFTNAAV